MTPVPAAGSAGQRGRHVRGPGVVSFIDLLDTTLLPMLIPLPPQDDEQDDQPDDEPGGGAFAADAEAPAEPDVVIDVMTEPDVMTERVVPAGSGPVPAARRSPEAEPSPPRGLLALAGELGRPSPGSWDRLAAELRCLESERELLHTTLGCGSTGEVIALVETLRLRLTGLIDLARRDLDQRARSLEETTRFLS